MTAAGNGAVAHLHTGGWLMEWGPKIDEKLDRIIEKQTAHEVAIGNLVGWQARKEQDITRFYEEQTRQENLCAARLMRLEETADAHEKQMALLVAEHKAEIGVANAKAGKGAAVGYGAAITAVAAIVMEVLSRLGG